MPKVGGWIYIWWDDGWNEKNKGGTIMQSDRFDIKSRVKGQIEMIVRVSLMLGIKYLILSFVLVEVYERLYLPHVSNSNAVPLIMNSSLKIVQFADLHFGEEHVKDRKTESVMREVLQIERPDLVVFSGDQISGYAIVGANERRKYWYQALSVVSDAGVPFATLFGNHDDQQYQFDPLLWHNVALGVAVGSVLVWASVWCCLKFGAFQRTLSLAFFAGSAGYLLTVPRRDGRVELVRGELEDFPGWSVTRQGDTWMHGVSNYRILVGLGKNVSIGLYFLDTGGGWIEEKVHEDQVNWIRSQEAGLWGLAFMHIPPVAFRGAYGKDRCTGMGPREGVSVCAGSETLGEALVQAGVRGVFVGHDHGNQWCCPFKGMQLCYGRHTGMGGYDFGEKSRGARVISVRLEPNGAIAMDTWIREIMVG
jgi:hypothetical protein